MEFSIRPNAPRRDYSYEVKETCEQCVDYFPMPKGDLRNQVEAWRQERFVYLSAATPGVSTFGWIPRGIRRSRESNVLPAFIQPTFRTFR